MSVFAPGWWTVGLRGAAATLKTPVGYLAMIVFVFVSAVVTFRPAFFARNAATLQTWTESAPLLLLFFIPALTMTAWADERRRGTDELLATLPVTTTTIVIGKFFGVWLVYLLSLLMSLPLVFVLGSLGEPGPGVVLGTYLGLLVCGTGLLAVGCFASALTAHATIAFVLGAGLLAVFVFPAELFDSRSFARVASLSDHLGNYAAGRLTLAAVVFSFGLLLTMLTLTGAVVDWMTDRSGQFTRLLHGGLRTTGWGVITGAALFSLHEQPQFLDVTAEQRHRLSGTTVEVLRELETTSPVTMRAFLSTSVPDRLADARQQLIRRLGDFDRLGGDRLDVSIVDVEPFSSEAEEARLLGVLPVVKGEVRHERSVIEEVTMGVVVTHADREVIIPFIDVATPIEYELATAVMAVTDRKRLTVGVLKTAADLITPSRDWEIVDRIRRIYRVEPVSPSDLTGERGDAIDVLLVAMPSSLTTSGSARLRTWIEGGRPTLLLDDPVPFVFHREDRGNVILQRTPRQPKPPRNRGDERYGMSLQPKASEGQALEILGSLGISWQYDRLLLDTFDPHPEIGGLDAGWVFITPKSGVETAIAPESPVTEGLREVMVVYSGTVQPTEGSELPFEPLLRTSPQAGLADWEEYVILPSTDDPERRRWELSRGIPLRSPLPTKRDEFSHVVSARVESTDPPRNAIFVADLDLMADWIVNERDRGSVRTLELDNVAFVMNCIDVLAGQERFLELRRPRNISRTLTTIERETKAVDEARLTAEMEAESEGSDELNRIRERFEKRRTSITEDDTLDELSRQQQLVIARETERRVLTVERRRIEDERNRERERARNEARSATRRIEQRFRWLAVILCPLPTIILGLCVWAWRRRVERRIVRNTNGTKMLTHSTPPNSESTT